MDKKKFRRDRTRNFFIDAACQIVDKQGLKDLSARKIADIAGYHFSTLYTYFEDIAEVKFYAALKFMDELDNLVENLCRNKTFSTNLEYYILVRKAVANYSIEHPEAYRLINFENLGKDVEKIITKLRSTKVVEYENKLFDKCTKEFNISKEKALFLHQLILSIFHSYFIGYSIERFVVEKEELIEKYLDEINMLFEIFKGK